MLLVCAEWVTAQPPLQYRSSAGPWGSLEGFTYQRHSQYLDALEKAGCREKNMTKEMQRIAVARSAFVRRVQRVCAVLL